MVIDDKTANTPALKEAMKIGKPSGVSLSIINRETAYTNFCLLYTSVRFGYVEVQLPQGLTEKGTAERSEPEKIKAHEFHYFDSTANGEDCIATDVYKRQASHWGTEHLRSSAGTDGSAG